MWTEAERSMSKGMRAQLLTPLVLMGVVLMMVVPMPSVILDVMLAANSTLAILALLATMMLKDSLELSVSRRSCWSRRSLVWL